VKSSALLIGFGVVILGAASPAWAFPPYRSTDAETADPWTLEARVGLIRVRHDAGENEYASPLLRVNFGLPYRFEIVSEFEYLPVEQRVGDAALGFKWIPLRDAASLGVEVLALLPVSEEGGAGIESSLLATYRAGDLFRTHVNVAGFYDARSSPAEWGWKAGAIGEFRLGRFRPGAEFFAKRVFGEPVQLLAGPGVIVTLGPIDVRTGVHFGLTEEAPDVTPSLWVTGALPFTRRPEP
jgi:hypothetical protein